MINLALWVIGVGMVVVAIWRVRRPYARMAQLDRLAENSRRYESWRGVSSRDEDRTSGADVMRQMMRRQVIFWAVVGVIGVVLVVAGFAVR